MKKKILLIAASVAAVALAALAGSPTFSQKTYFTGTAASPGQVIFPSDPTLQIRVVHLDWRSDTNNANLQFSGGSTAYVCQSNCTTAASVNTVINSTNGLTGTSVLVLEHGGVGYAASVSSWVGPTNVVLASGGWGSPASVGDNVYLMDTPVNRLVGVGTNSIDGEAIYVAALAARPVMIKITPCGFTNGISPIVRYE